MKPIYSFTITFSLLIFLSCGGDHSDADSNENTDSLDLAVDTLDDLIGGDEASFDSTLLEAINEYLDAAINGDVDYLVKHTEYPIVRLSPLPGWSDQNDFKNAFESAFDDSLIGLFHKFQLYPDIIDRSGATGEIGILDGALWFTITGELTGFNYVAQLKENKKKELKETIRQSIHPAVQKYNYNLFTGKTDEYIIRIDDTDEKGLRYAQWSTKFTMSDEPDYMLYNGEWGQDGSGGGWHITFEDKDGPVVEKNVAMCESEDGCGYFLSNAKGENRIERELDQTKLLK